MRTETIISFLVKPATVWVVMSAIALFVGLQLYWSGSQYAGHDCRPDSNYQLFKASFDHLMSDRDLYSFHPEHCYTFKYCPSFALLFGFFTLFPDWAGISLWCLLTPLVTFFAIRSLRPLTDVQKALFFILIVFEFVSCLRSTQTNFIVAGFIVLAFANLEKKNYFVATLLIVSTGFLKIFGFGAMLIFLFYPDKKKLAFYSLLWGAILFFLPLIVISFSELMGIYQDWREQISGDYVKYAGLNIYSFFQTTMGIELNKMLVLAASLGLMLVTVAQYKKWDQYWFRQLTVAMLLVWFVPFNHKAESASYGIAAMGIAVWYFSARRRWPDHVLLVLMMCLLSILFSDLTPKWIRTDFAFPYNIKALPCVIIWMRILIEMWMRKDETPALSEENAGAIPKAV